MKKSNIADFVRHHYRHFNAAAVVDAAEGYKKLLDAGGGMMIVMAGAMSTAEIGLSLAEMIRRDKVQAISCTGANLEEDIFNLVARNHYVRIPDYRNLNPADEEALLNRHMNRVTDTCIPEEEAIRRIEDVIVQEWEKADKNNQQYFPHEYFYKLIQNKKLEKHFQIDPKDSWMIEYICVTLPA